MVKNTYINKYLGFALIINFFISLVFLILTKDNAWISDDYPYIFGTKLFNLINNQNFFVFEFMGNPDRFNPLFWFIIQFIPENFILWHLIVVFVFFLTSILIFSISKKITNNNNISILTSVLFSLNYSISTKALSWNIFFGHIFNSFLGFLSILIFLNFIKKNSNKNAYLIFYLITSSLGIFIMETGLIYPLLTLVIVYLFERNNLLKKSIIILSPLIFYVLIVLLYTGKVLPNFFDRLHNQTFNIDKNKFSKDMDEDLYHYRSTYAPRDLKGYSLRVFDNLILSMNISSIEDTIKFYDKDNNFKNNLKKKLPIIIVFFILFLSIFIFFLYKEISKSKNKHTFNKIIFLYIFTFLIYSLVFFRRDLNLALSFSSGLLISFVVCNFYERKKYILFYFILTLFILPSILYASTKFEYFGDFKRSENILVFEKYKNLSREKNLNKNIKTYNDFKYYYYFKNYKSYKSEISKYKNLSLNNFIIRFDFDQ
ncbi:MAG: hypothetical protein CMG67_00170 [Candidatus Marinimicrobia bacterium]|nr:hypothetical protein [Candidatus Neomarinimicrobiota bacterium]|tara:strand:+ start:5947 stop:7401 length:1455 start_codon:yes stop_codon:yes gene_type:complete